MYNRLRLKKWVYLSFVFLMSTHILAADNVKTYTSIIPEISSLLGQPKSELDSYIQSIGFPYRVVNVLGNNIAPNINGMKKLIFSLPPQNNVAVEITYALDKVYKADIKVDYVYPPLGNAKEPNQYTTNVKQINILNDDIIAYLNVNGWKSKSSLFSKNINYAKDDITVSVSYDNQYALNMEVTQLNLKNELETIYNLENNMNKQHQVKN